MASIKQLAPKSKMAIIILMFVGLLFGTNTVTADGLSDYFALDCSPNKTLNLDVSQTMVYFYDFENDITVNGSITTIANDINEVDDLDKTKKIICFVPGYSASISDETEQWTIETFRDASYNNLIIIDYSYYIKKPLSIDNYLDAVKHVYDIGKAIGEFLAELNDCGYPAENIHCVGHSLGGQIINYAAEVFTEITCDQLWRLSSLDAAGPCFEKNAAEEQLHSGTAEYVENYHCSEYSTNRDLADTDFYVNPNDDDVQPGCEGGRVFKETGLMDEQTCGHLMCMIYWLQSVSDPSVYRSDNATDDYSYECDSSDAIVAGYNNPGLVTGVTDVYTEISDYLLV